MKAGEGMVARLLLLASGLLAGGCGSIGSKTVYVDRFDYSEALSSTWKQQMLVNMVKLRYGDTPVFLDVASVINQYSVETQVDMRFNWVSPVVSIGDSQSVGGSARYSDKPTITYTPLAGERFARSLMKPLPPSAVLSLIQAGYPVDLVLRICTHSVNGVRNRYGGASRARPADPEFYPLLGHLRRIQDSGSMGLRVQKVSDTEAIMMALRGGTGLKDDGDAQAVRKILKLDPAAHEFRVAYGAVAKDDKEIAILSRSVLEITIDLASFIEVPAEHVEQQRVGATMALEMIDGKPMAAPIRIQGGASAPGDAFARIKYRDSWYWIDDRDLRSKSVFSFMMFIFSLTETEGREGAPIVTIPAG